MGKQSRNGGAVARIAGNIAKDLRRAWGNGKMWLDKRERMIERIRE
jgi:hypothetical protein